MAQPKLCISHWSGCQQANLIVCSFMKRFLLVPSTSLSVCLSLASLAQDRIFDHLQREEGCYLQQEEGPSVLSRCSTHAMLTCKHIWVSLL